MSSAYDYVINETLGFHVDYDKTLGEQIEQYQKSHPRSKVLSLSQGRLDQLAEKCTPAIIDMHRPIVFSETADFAEIIQDRGGAVPKLKLGHPLTRETFEYAQTNVEDTLPTKICGTVTGYNSTAFNGRLFLPSEGRRISFYLTDSARTPDEVDLVTRSLSVHARQKRNHTPQSAICMLARTVRSKSGKLKKLNVTDVMEN